MNRCGLVLKNFYVLLALVAICGCPVTLFSADTTGVDTTAIPFAMTFWGTRGLTQVASAEPQGAGRMSICLTGTGYEQKTTFPGVPNDGALIGTSTLAFSFGASENIELFGNASVFTSANYTSTHQAGLGAISAGLQGMLPLPAQAPFHLGAQAILIGGTSANQIDANHADGYDYLETRTNFDIMGRAIESFHLGSEYVGLKIMFNEAFTTSVEKSQSNLVLLGAGLQAIMARYYIIGLEVNSRTYLDDMELQTDPLWMTPSLTFRSPYYFNVLLGSDISLSQDRTADPAVRALEQYRLFASVTFSVDVLARRRAEAAQKEKQRLAEKAALEQTALQLKNEKDSLTVKARQDSLAQARKADSLAQVAHQLRTKAIADSVALAESQRTLVMEKSKRTDAEKQLLSTGMLLLDAVYFESGKAEISINSKPYLKIIAKMLAKYPKLRIEVGGHTDSQGRFETNQRLSQIRAEAVRAFLIDVAPELSDRLTATGYGSIRPKANNVSAEGRRSNRRTELVVINKEALKEYNP